MKTIRIIAIIFILIIASIPFIPSNKAEAATTVTKVYQPPSFGADIGPATFIYNTTGVFWSQGSSQMGVTALGTNFYVGSSKCAVAYNSAFSQNSTTYIWTFTPSNAVSCGGDSLTPTMHMYVDNVTGAYNQKEIFVPFSILHVGPNVFTTEIVFPYAVSGTPSNCRQGINQTTQLPFCTSVSNAQTTFNWSGIKSLKPLINNQTHVITVNSSAFSGLLDPLAIDGSAACVKTLHVCTITLTTTSSPDVVILFINTDGSSITKISTITGTSGLSFHFRENETAVTNGFWELVANASATLTAATIIITVPASPNESPLGLAFGISGAQTSSSSFDNNAAIPNLCTGATGAPTCTVTTSNANDFIVSATVDYNLCQNSYPSTYTIIQDTCPPSSVQGAVAVYKVVSATQSSVSLTWNYGANNQQWGEINDAIMQASAGTTAYSATFSASISLTQSLNQALGIAQTQTASLTPSLNVGAANSIKPNETITATVTAGLGITVTKSATLSPSVNQGLGITLSASIVLGIMITAIVSGYVYATFSARPVGPIIWDDNYSIAVTDLNTTAVVCTILATLGGGTATCSGNFPASDTISMPLTFLDTAHSGATWDVWFNPYSWKAVNTSYTVNYYEPVKAGGNSVINPDLYISFIVILVLIAMAVLVVRRKRRY